MVVRGGGVVRWTLQTMPQCHHVLDGAHVEAQCKGNRPPLALVWWFWSPDPFDVLVVVCGAQSGWTALTEAGSNGHTSTVALLLEKGASVDHADQVKRRCLCSSSATQAPESVCALCLGPVVSVVLPMRQFFWNGGVLLLRSPLTRRTFECCDNSVPQPGGSCNAQLGLLIG